MVPSSTDSDTASDSEDEDEDEDLDLNDDNAPSAATSASASPSGSKSGDNMPVSAEGTTKLSFSPLTNAVIGKYPRYYRIRPRIISYLLREVYRAPLFKSTRPAKCYS